MAKIYFLWLLMIFLYLWSDKKLNIAKFSVFPTVTLMCQALTNTHISVLEMFAHLCNFNLIMPLSQTWTSNFWKLVITKNSANISNWGCFIAISSNSKSISTEQNTEVSIICVNVVHDSNNNQHTVFLKVLGHHLLPGQLQSFLAWILQVSGTQPEGRNTSLPKDIPSFGGLWTALESAV